MRLTTHEKDVIENGRFIYAFIFEELPEEQQLYGLPVVQPYLCPIARVKETKH